jgi:Tat protein translocase TatC
MIVGIFVALPVLIYNLLRFIEPALPKKISKRQMLAVIGGSFILAMGGILFGYYVMVPMSLKFFGSYSTAQIKPLISADQYLTYLMNNLIVFALVFQIPLLALFINRIKPTKPSQLLRYQRHVIVGAFIFALVLPFTYDPITQFVVAVPVVILFYTSVVLIWIANLRRKPFAQEAAVIHEPEPLPETTSQPSFEPVFEQATEPVSAPNVALKPVTSATKAIDGFIHDHKPTVAIAPPRPRVYEPIVQVKSRRPITIDGFLPPLATSA